MTWTFSVCIHILFPAVKMHFEAKPHSIRPSPVVILALHLCLSNDFFWNLFVRFVYFCFRLKHHRNWPNCVWFSQRRCGWFLHHFLLLMMVLIVSIWTGSHNCKRWIVIKFSRIHWWRRRPHFYCYVDTKTKVGCACLCLGWNPMTIFISFHSICLSYLLRAFRWKWMNVCIINLSIH